MSTAAVVVTSSLVWSVTFMGGFWPFGDAEPDDQTTIGNLEPHEVELVRTPIVEDGAPRAREQYRIFLELSDDYPELQMEAMRRLGDLNRAAGEN